MDLRKRTRPENKGDRLWIFIFFLSCCFAIWISTPWIIERFDHHPEHRGTTGDMFGAVNALFSGFAFAGVIYTIYLQRNELALQREEMRRATDEQANQTLLMQAQIQAVKQAKDFDKYTNLMEAEPLIVISQLKTSHDKRFLTVVFVNLGKNVYSFMFSAKFEGNNEVYKSSGCEDLINGESFSIQLPIKENPMPTVSMRISYKNGLLYELRRVLEIDLSDESIREKYNNILENLDIPEIYERKGRDLYLET